MERNDFLLKRVERLERSNRRLKVIGLVVFAAIGTMGATQGISHTFGVLNAKQINAEGISIIDANGKFRVAIGADPTSDQGGVSIFQRNGIVRAALGEDTGGSSGVTASDGNGALRMAGVQLADDTTLISTFTATGAPRGTVITTPSGDTNIVATGAPGAASSLLYSTKTTGESGLSVYSPDVFPTLNIETSPNNDRVGIGIYGANGMIREVMGVFDPLGGDPNEVMDLFAPDGTLLASMNAGVTSPDGRVQTYFANGTQSGQLP